MDTKDTKSIYSHILKYTGLFGGVQMLNILIGVVRYKLVAVLLGTMGMGLVSLFNSVITFVSQGTSLGVSFSAVRQLSEYFESGDEQSVSHYIKVVRGWSFLAALLGMFVCVAIGPLLNHYTFSWGDHTLHFVLLAPVVAMMAITGGETAILKGCRRLKALAVIQVWTVLLALVISAPVYYFFGISGIVPVFVLAAFAAMLITIFYSYRFYPLKIKGMFGVLGEGTPMVRLGVAFVVGATFGAAGEVVVRSFLNVNDGLDIVGLYNAGYMLTITYASMVFTSMETDYFPRLSAVNKDADAVNDLVNRQAEVSLLIISPLLVALILLLPLIVPLLLSSSFTPVVPMAQLAALSLYFKAITLPMAYINLAKGNSLAFLVLEALYAIVFVAFIVVGFIVWGLLGTGAALVAAHVFDCIMIFVYVHIKYHYSISRSLLLYLSIQIPLGMAAYAITFVNSLLLYSAFGVVITACSAWFSFFILSRNTSLNGIGRNLFHRK